MSKTKPLKLRASYMAHVYAPQSEIVTAARRTLKGVQYDTLVGRGLSGALIVPLLARALRKNWCIVRKAEDKAHSWKTLEGDLGAAWVFVDDLIDTGATRDAVFKAMTEACRYGHQTTYVGTYLYGDYGSRHKFLPSGSGRAKTWTAPVIDLEVR